MSPGTLILGTSGWSYEEWLGPFYGPRDKRKLSYYSSIFKTAEIDSTFYAYPSEGTVWGWARHTPRDFFYS